MNDDNVVQFNRPKTKANGPEIDDGLIERVWTNALDEMVKGGCNLASDTDKYFPSMALLYESIASLHMLTKNEEHPLQKFADAALSYESIFDSTTDYGIQPYPEEEVFLDGERMTLDQMFKTIEEEHKNS